METLTHRRGMLGTAGVLMALAGLGLLDLFSDVSPFANWPHALLEIVFLTLCLGLAAHLLREVRRQAQFAAELKSSLMRHTEERDAWRSQAQDYLKGLGETLARQFKDWKLTPTESQVALLLLKGFSTQEIALLHDRSERTVRQHAIAVYRKAQVTGRAELSAFFLEDLLLPPDGALQNDTGLSK